MENNRKCKGGWRELDIYFCDNAEEPVTFRVYESMYETMKDAFYGGKEMPVFVIGYLVNWDNAIGHEVSGRKSFINMRNVTRLEVVDSCDGHG